MKPLVRLSKLAGASVAPDWLLTGGVTLLLPNPERRYPLACGPEPERLAGSSMPGAGPSGQQLAGVAVTDGRSPPVPAEQDGVITGILVKNGQTVEYGTPLFQIGG